MSQHIAMIGAGNMGSSLVGGLIKNGFDAGKITVSDTSTAQLDTLQKKFSVKITTSNQEAIQSADVVILAVKPQIMPLVAKEIAATIQEKKPLILSIAAGLNIHHFENWFGKDIPIVRSMPNIAALISEGATALCANKHVSPAQKQLAETILKAVGIAVWIEDENLMDAVTALSGSGPAYFFLLIEILAAAGEKLGLPNKIATALATQTAYGATLMAKETGEDPKELRRKVTSPGGTTEAAINALETKNIREIFLNALESAVDRARELAK